LAPRVTVALPKIADASLKLNHVYKIFYFVEVPNAKPIRIGANGIANYD
jgi:hypothetical protein